MNSLSLQTLDFLKSAARSNGQILNTDIYVTAIADGRTRFFGGSQSTSGLRIFGVRKPISDVKTPKTSTGASAAFKGDN